MVKRSIGYALIICCSLFFIGMLGNFLTYSLKEIITKFNHADTAGYQFLFSTLIGNGLLLFVLYKLSQLGLKLIRQPKKNL